jgi:hypothetical protein
MGRAERSTAGKLDVALVVVVLVDGVAGREGADVTASMVAPPPALLQDARRTAATNTPRRIPRA